MTAVPFNIAVIGTGRIAYRFAADLRYSGRARIVAVGGRDLSKAERLAQTIGAGVRALPIPEAIEQPDVQAVYIATGNEVHAEHAMLAIEAGKSVLVEKPLASRVDDAQRLAEAARSAGVFAMEAMWMRFTPGIRRLKTWIHTGKLGTVQRLQAGVSFRAKDPAPADAATGVLLDLGVYPISLALDLLGPVDSVSAFASRRPDGTVAEVDLVLTHRHATALLSCGRDAEGINKALVQGTHGIAETGGMLLCPSFLSRRRLSPDADDRMREVEAQLPKQALFGYERTVRDLLRPLRNPPIPTPYKGSGLHYQVDHMVACIADGLTESPLMPLADSCEALRLIESAADDIRGATTKIKRTMLAEADMLPRDAMR